MKLSILLLFIFPFGLFAQKFEKEKNRHFGVITNYVTSSLHMTGLNLLAFGELKKHQIAVGTRYAISGPINFATYSKDYAGTAKSVVLDFDYRYSIFDKSKRFNTFAQFTSEINFRKNEATYFYDPNYTPEIDPSQHTAYGPIFENSFNASIRAKGTYLGFYIGVGEEVKIVKGLFATLHFGAGTIFGKSMYEISDIDKNAVVYSRKNDHFYMKNKIAYTGSVGLGYRF
jgi:hypothetical protein